MSRADTMLTTNSVIDWLDAYKRAWEEQDIDLITSLFTEGARYVENPFNSPLVGRGAIAKYWLDGAVSTQRDIRFTSTLWSVTENIAIAHWQAEFTRMPTGRHARLDGVFHLRFNAKWDRLPLCDELREWWFVIEQYRSR